MRRTTTIARVANLGNPPTNVRTGISANVAAPTSPFLRGILQHTKPASDFILRFLWARKQGPWAAEKYEDETL